MLYFLKGLSTNTNINAFLPQKMNNIMTLGRWIFWYEVWFKRVPFNSMAKNLFFKGQICHIHTYKRIVLLQDIICSK